MKKKIITLMLNIVTLGLYTFYVGAKLEVYEKDAWYQKWYLWVIGFLLGIIPGIVMLLIFYIKVGCLVSEKLNVPMQKYYSYPYVWIFCFIVPILGWSIFTVLNIYVHTWYCAYLESGD